MVELPSGAVTFLFTDIQGSTALVKRLRERYGAVLAEHQRLLRAAFDAHDGYEVDTQGDSFFVAFASAREALLAAVEAQRALASHAWPDGVEIAVRMGLHTGQAVAQDGRYTGLAVHRAARIGAAGHGGQILVSQATQTLLEDEEEDLRVHLRDLGEQRLKDLERPVRLYQAEAEGLPASFPPPRQAGPEHVGAEADARRPWRRVVLVAGVAALASLVTGAALALRDGGGGLDAVQPDRVGIVDPGTNDIVAEVPVGIRPGPVAAGEGAVWVGNLEERSLTKIDPAARTRTATIPLERRTPTGIAAGLGAVWVAHGLRGDVSRVDPRFGDVTDTTPVGGTAFGSPHGVVALDRETVWAAFGDSTLARLNGAGRVLERGLAGAQPAGLVAAAGSIWVTNSGDATVQRFNARSFTQGPLETFNVPAQPSGIALADGVVWVASTDEDVVTRIDAASGASLQIPVGDGPTAIAAGLGAVWVANTAGRTISRIDPEANEVVATIEIGNAPAGLVVADGLVWVAVQAP